MSELEPEHVLAYEKAIAMVTAAMDDEIRGGGLGGPLAGLSLKSTAEIAQVIAALIHMNMILVQEVYIGSDVDESLEACWQRLIRSAFPH